MKNDRIFSRSAAIALAVFATAAGADEKKGEQDAAHDIAAAAPANDIYLAALEKHKAGVTLGEPRNVTHRPGYDNQPAFLPDGQRFYYTSIHEDGQADIWRYDIASGESKRITSTPESEYSPTVPPDGVGISIVRVEKDGSQRLWRYSDDGTPGKAIVNDEKAVGYHAWIDEDTLALFIVAEPPVLRTVDLRSKRTRDIATGIGRCIQAVPGRPEVAYIEPNKDGSTWLKLLQWPAGLTRLLTPPVEGSEDFTLAPDGEVYMAHEQAIYAWQHEAGKWSVIADFAGKLPGAITRLTVSPHADLIAFVVAEGPETK
jgi:dipeptidyl aminopeptidase/acylaminoacyl peptidase